MYKPLYKSKMLLLIFSLLLCSQAFTVESFAQNSLIKKDSSPTIQFEKRQYEVDEVVPFEVAGFDRFEQISIFVRDLNGFQKGNNSLANWIVFADMNGKTTFEWRIPARSNYEVILIRDRNNNFGVRTTVSSLVPVPVNIGANPSCADVNASGNAALAHIASNFGFKIDGNGSGTFTFENNGNQRELTGGAPADPGNTVTTTVTNSGRNLEWLSTRPITAVIVKGGNDDANVYPYNPASMGDPGPLTVFNPNQDISHVEFCFQPDAKIIIKKHATPPSLQQFNFTATPGLTPANFTLVDDQINSDPMQMFTVNTFNVKTITEVNPPNFELRSIVCTVDIGTGGTPTPVRSGNSVQIDIKSGDQVTCTFNNDLLTASATTVSGQVFNPSGRGLSRASVSITDLSGNVRTTTTNQFGYFRFEEVGVGENYVIEVRHRLYLFDSQTIGVSEDILGLNFYPKRRTLSSR